MLRFAMRAPSIGAPVPDLYEAALDMVEWAESRGCVNVTVCEHHASSDGYLPSPLVLASVVAARTRQVRITVAVALLPLYDEVRLAEELVALDNLSHDRVGVVTAIGYRPIEYEMYGVDFHRRGAIAEEKLGVLLRAKTGEPFEHEGRRIHVTPTPFTPGGPMVAWGGGSLPAARRAGRHGIGFMAQAGDASLRGAYEEAARAAGHEPGLCILPNPQRCQHDLRRARRGRGLEGARSLPDARCPQLRGVERGRRGHGESVLRGLCRGAASGESQSPDLERRRGGRVRSSGLAARAASVYRWSPARDGLEVSTNRRR